MEWSGKTLNRATSESSIARISKIKEEGEDDGMQVQDEEDGVMHGGGVSSNATA